jgi:hypothetical protein
VNGYVSKDKLIGALNRGISQAQTKYRASGMPPEARETVRWIEGAVRTLEELTSTHMTAGYLNELLKSEDRFQKVLEWAIKQAARMK